MEDKAESSHFTFWRVRLRIEPRELPDILHQDNFIWLYEVSYYFTLYAYV